MRVPTKDGIDPQSSHIAKIVDKFRPDPDPFEAIYRDLHQNPELSCQESRTAKIASDHLASLEFTVIGGLGGHGVVGCLENGAGPTVLVRSELDALPVLEKTGLPFASKKQMIDTNGKEKPVMHACGHDLHIAALMAAASLLHAAKGHWSGRLLVLFQPNEERGGGARAMIRDGLYAEHGVPSPDVVLGQHIINTKPGALRVGSGYALAGKKAFRIQIPGRGGHVGTPQNCIDPVVTTYLLRRHPTTDHRQSRDRSKRNGHRRLRKYPGWKHAQRHSGQGGTDCQCESVFSGGAGASGGSNETDHRSRM